MSSGLTAQPPSVAAARAADDLRFKVLGPLEVWAGQQRLPVGGPKQRAILGYLLVHANEVAATSQMVGALWPAGAPSTARKMLQNTVSNIRGLLSAHGGGGPSMLLTHPPGYLLRTDAASLDLLRFEQFAQAGRAALADGAWDRASRSLRASLDLWRGEPLADLRDAGLNWSKLSVLRDSWLTTFEDYFEAELRRGRHREHVAALEQLVSDEPHRERAACQLMLALYRSGRQVDALEVYRRTHEALRGQLGLDATRNLRDLERAILEHAPCLQTPEILAPVRLRPIGTESAGTAPADADVTEVSSERRSLSILTIAFEVCRDADVDDADALLAEVSSEVRSEIDAAGGLVVFCTGSIMQAVFGAAESVGDDPLATAVRTAVGVRERFLRAGRSVQVRLSLRTESVLIAFRGGLVEPVGAALEQCVRSARMFPPNEVWVCETTRLRGGLDVADATRSGRPALQWARMAKPGLDSLSLPFVDRDHELAILDQYLDQTIGRGRGRLLTVLGEAGIGKTRLLSEWSSRLRTLPDPPLVLKAAVPPPGTPGATRTMFADLFAGLPGAQTDRPHAPGRTTAERLLSVIDSLGPAVLILENLQLADSAVQQFVDRLVGRIGALPVLAVATTRLPVPHDERWQLRPFTVMTLDRISQTGVELLWNAALAGDADQARLSPRLVKEIDGNPRSAIELARRHRDSRRPRPREAVGAGRRV